MQQKQFPRCTTTFGYSRETYRVNRPSRFLSHIPRSHVFWGVFLDLPLSFALYHSALMARLEAKLGPSSEALDVIRQEMARDYYSAAPRLVDPLLTRYKSA